MKETTLPPPREDAWTPHKFYFAKKHRIRGEDQTALYREPAVWNGPPTEDEMAADLLGRFYRLTNHVLENPRDPQPRATLIKTAQLLRSMGKFSDENIADLALALKMENSAVLDHISPPKR